jgi:hypothetical protein
MVEIFPHGVSSPWFDVVLKSGVKTEETARYHLALISQLVFNTRPTTKLTEPKAPMQRPVRSDWLNLAKSYSNSHFEILVGFLAYKIA